MGTQEVAALRARNTAEVARLELFQQLGVPMPEGVELLADLPMTMPTKAPPSPYISVMGFMKLQ